VNVAGSSFVPLGQAPKRVGEKWRGGKKGNNGQTNQYHRRTNGARTWGLGKGVRVGLLTMSYYGTHIEEEVGAIKFESACRQ